MQRGHEGVVFNTVKSLVPVEQHDVQRRNSVIYGWLNDSAYDEASVSRAPVWLEAELQIGQPRLRACILQSLQNQGCEDFVSH